MIIVTSERTKGSNCKDQEGEAKEMIWRDDEPRTGKRIEGPEEKKKEDRRTSASFSYLEPDCLD